MEPASFVDLDPKPQKTVRDPPVGHFGRPESSRELGGAKRRRWKNRESMAFDLIAAEWQGVC